MNFKQGDVIIQQGPASSELGTPIEYDGRRSRHRAITVASRHSQEGSNAWGIVFDQLVEKRVSKPSVSSFCSLRRGNRRFFLHPL